MMIHLFQNLISNSIKYHGEKNPEIHISADNVNDVYIFAIKDNGIGIDENHLERIFTIFQRLHTREEYEGTGIGLAIVQKIVQKHRGKIWVESRLGKGTTFYFTIPNQSY
jgi:light-regulated signal transduction histidine kinase (bacteriophytochrome)